MKTSERNLWLAALVAGVLAAWALSPGGAEARVFGPSTVSEAILAARPNLGETVLLSQLNGEVTKLGTLETTGTSVTNSTTGTAFTIAPADCPSRIIMYDCDTAGMTIGNGATCSETITNANYKPTTLTAHQFVYFILDSVATTTAICLDSNAVAAKCAVFCLR